MDYRGSQNEIRKFVRPFTARAKINSVWDFYIDLKQLEIISPCFLELKVISLHAAII